VSLELVPIHVADANKFVRDHHRHNRPTLSGKFAIGLSDGAGIIGVAIVGRPIARMLQDGYTAEVLRTCVLDGSPKGSNSMLYSACWRAWRAMGGRKLITYTLRSESGASLRGAGWRIVGEVSVRRNPWHGPDRKREYQPVYGQQKLRWEVSA
jgi:hypothetical protein